jgi:hypothetical protein
MCSKYYQCRTLTEPKLNSVSEFIINYTCLFRKIQLVPQVFRLDIFAFYPMCRLKMKIPQIKYIYFISSYTSR